MNVTKMIITTLDNENKFTNSQIKHTLNQHDMKPIVIFVYMNGCHFCDVMKPEWKSFTDLYKKEPTNDFSILEVERNFLDSHKNNNPLLNTLNSNVSGFPSIFFKNRDGFNKYQDERVMSNIQKFVNQNVRTNSHHFHQSSAGCW